MKFIKISKIKHFYIWILTKIIYYFFKIISSVLKFQQKCWVKYTIIYPESQGEKI